MPQSHLKELCLLLTCFYIYLNCQTIIYVKQVIFRYPLSSSPFTYPYSYIYIRTIAGTLALLIYRFLLLYAFWRKMVDLILISIISLIGLMCLRIIFDFYGYYSGDIQQSLYYPFESFKTKSMTEEMIDLLFEFIKNCFGLGLSIYLLINLVHVNRSRRSTKDSNYRSSLSDQN